MRIAKKTILTAAGVVTLGAGLGVAGFASADPTTTPAPAPSSSASATPGSPADQGPRGGGPGRGGHGARGGADAAELASKLGVDEAKVREALAAVREETKPAAKPDPGAAKPDPGAAKPDPAERDTALAKALAPKLDVEEAKIKTALDEIREARQADRASELKTRLDTAVTDGKLTQAEADAVQKAVEQGVIGAGPR